MGMAGMAAPAQKAETSVGLQKFSDRFLALLSVMTSFSKARHHLRDSSRGPVVRAVVGTTPSLARERSSWRTRCSYGWSSSSSSLSALSRRTMKDPGATCSICT